MLIWASVALLVVSAVISSNAFSVRDRLFGSAAPAPAVPAAGRDASVTVPTTIPTEATSLRSQPWWQTVAVLEGAGSGTPAPFTVAEGAIQWRVQWSCDTGDLVVAASGQDEPVVDGSCPDGETGYGLDAGETELEVRADGPWTLEVAQQIDTPLVEPLLPGMTGVGSEALTSGTAYNIDKTAEGTMTIYRQVDGTFALRLDEFFVSPSADLELRLSPLDSPSNSTEFIDAGSELIAVMDVTAGSLNYVLPDGLDPTQFGSVVVWCPPINSAYAAATMAPVQ